MTLSLRQRLFAAYSLVVAAALVLVTLLAAHEERTAPRDPEGEHSGERVEQSPPREHTRARPRQDGDDGAE